MSRTSVVAMTRCGYCSFGNAHNRCPGGVRNGNGTIHPCGCRETSRCGSIRCTDCNNRDAETIGEDWRCLNRDDCMAEQERQAQANPVVMRIRAIVAEHKKAPSRASEDLDPTDIPARAPRRSRGATEAGRPCLCECGETTGGGRFRPGHDSKYLNKLVNHAGDESRGLAYDVSEAFGKKYDKRTAQ